MTRRHNKTKPNSKNSSSHYGQKRGEQRPLFDMLGPDDTEYQDILNEASIYDEIIEAHEESGEKITERDYKEAAEKLEKLYGLKKHFNTVKNRFHRYVGENLTGLRNRIRGPEAGSDLTPKQTSVLEGLCVKRKWRVMVDKESGKEYFVLRRVYIKEIYDAVDRVPKGKKVSPATVARLVRRFLESHKEEFILAHKGESKLVQERMPKKPNNVPGPNARWQYDMRPLPHYVLVGDIVCRVIASCIIDDFTQNPIECLFFARKEEGDDRVRTVDTTTVDARRQIALAILNNEVCPPDIYTDNGPPFREDLKKHLKIIGAKNKNSKPGYPPGRGKVEKFLDLLDEALRKIPGYIEDDNEREQWKEVLKLPLLPFEKFLERINEEVDKIRKKSTRKGGKENRYDIWKNSDNRYALPMPSQNKLGVFANSVATYSARVYTIGVLKNNVYYVPIKRTEDTEMLWARTVGKYIPLRFAAVGEHIFAYVSFNNKDWVPVEPRSVSDREVGEHMSLRGKVLKKIKDSKRVKLEAIDTIMLETHKGTVSVDEFFERYDELTEVMPQQPDNTEPTLAPQNGVNKPSQKVIPGSDSQHDPLGEQREADGPSPNENQATGNSDYPADTRRASDGKTTENGQRQDDQESSVRAHTSDSDLDETPLPIPPSESALEGQNQNSEQLDTSGITVDEASESRNTPSTTSPQPPSDNYAARLRERFQRDKNNANK